MTLMAAQGGGPDTTSGEKVLHPFFTRGRLSTLASTEGQRDTVAINPAGEEFTKPNASAKSKRSQPAQGARSRSPKNGARKGQQNPKVRLEPQIQDHQLTPDSGLERRLRVKPPRQDDTDNPSHSVTKSEPSRATAKSSGFQSANFPTAIEAIWPTKDMFHIRGFSVDGARAQARKSAVNCLNSHRGQRKQKETALQVLENENILNCLARRLKNSLESSKKAAIVAENGSEDWASMGSETLHLPGRNLLTRSATRKRLRPELRTQLAFPGQSSPNGFDDDSQALASFVMERHPALLKLYHAIGRSFTPFDLARCETQAWTVKYAPSSAKEVLQPAKEAMILHEWLKNLVLSSDDAKKPKLKHSRESAAPGKRSRTASPHKRQRKSPRKSRTKDEMSGFIVSNGDECDDMEELSGSDEEHEYPGMPRTVVRANETVAALREKTTTRLSNAILISGPSGCGKTAAAYAVAKELDYEVFEMSPGGRRNGKDLLEKVGDMTRNHQVQRSKDTPIERDPLELDSSAHTNGCTSGSDNHKATSIGSFFKPRRTMKQPSESEPKKDITSTSTSTSNDVSTGKHAPRLQKQSLILLEEVDVLFEEDKSFWAAVLGLLAQSKRPVIMTCNDEKLVPVNDLALHAILRFRPPPIDLAVDYLLLLAAAEGHLLRRPAVEALYQSKRCDLRASIMEIDFWCQVAVGDRKGGLDWIHPRSPTWDQRPPDAHTLHVVSDNTYTTGMGWVSGDAVLDNAGDPIAAEQELLTEAWNEWDVGIDEWYQSSAMRQAFEHLTSTYGSGLGAKLAASRECERFYDTLSSADVFAGHALAAGRQIFLDTTQPPIPNHVRVDTVQGYSLIDVNPVIPHQGVSTDLATYPLVLAKQAFGHVITGSGGPPCVFNHEILIELVKDKVRREVHPPGVTRIDLSAAFDPISEAPGSAPATPGALQCSEFDRPLSLIVEDLAPYIRSIVLHDAQLADQLRQMQEQSTTRMRTTRASRCALEGGNRSTIRPDKWFGSHLDADLVLKTGSPDWYQAAKAPMGVK